MRSLLDRRFARRSLLRAAGTSVAAALAAACGATPTPQVIKEVVTQVVEKEVTKIVEGTPQVVKETVVVTTEVEKVVKETVVVEKVVAPTPEAITIEFVYNVWPGWQEALEQIIVNFQEANPHLTVAFTNMDWGQFIPALTPRFAAGEPPDIVASDGAFPWVQEFQLLDLRPFVERDQLDLSVIKALDPARVVGDPTGGQYGLPFDFTGSIVAWNKTMFDQYGIPYPEPGTWTMDAFREAAITLTRDADGNSPADSGFDAGNIKVYGASLRNSNMLDQFIRAFGGATFSEDRLTCAIDSSEATEAISFWYDLACNSHAVIGPNPTEQPGAADPFASGATAISIDGEWMMGLWEEGEDFDWDVAASPEGPAGQFQYGASDTLGIPRQAKQMEAAWQFLKYLVFDKEAQMLVAASTSPALAEAALTDEFIGLHTGKRGPSPEMVRWAYERMHAGATADVFNHSLRKDEWGPIWNDMFTSILTLCDQEPVALAVDTASQITEILQRKE